MTRLLVSVRSAEEAQVAAMAGADVIDVKEPDRGALGMADPSVWSEILKAVPERVAVSVALGELTEWGGDKGALTPELNAFDGLAFRKIGLAGTGPAWAEEWHTLRDRLGGDTPWVAVVYSDWARARAPEPAAVLEVALSLPACHGVLFDTWDKSRANPIEAGWAGLFARVREAGRFSALAGGLTERNLDLVAHLHPEILAVRGAACQAGDRTRRIDPNRVTALARALSSLEEAKRGHSTFFEGSYFSHIFTTRQIERPASTDPITQKRAQESL